MDMTKKRTIFFFLLIAVLFADNSYPADIVSRASDTITLDADGILLKDVLRAHEVRNLIIYNPDYKLSSEEAKRVLDTYESAAKEIGIS